jgi:hypothetical protein
MMGNYQVRFGGGRMEKELHSHLVSRLPDTPDSLEDDQALFVTHLCTRCPDVQIGHRLISEFLRSERERDLQALDQLFQHVELSKLAELVSFAAGQRRDEAAVRAALRLPYGNGQVEGKINKLKLLKRRCSARLDSTYSNGGSWWPDYFTKSVRDPLSD